MKLFAHQQRFVEIARTRNRYAWFADPGCGKTIGTLAACAERPAKTLVLAPKTILECAWGRDAANFPQLRTVIVRGGGQPKQRLAAIRGEWDIAVTNYECFKTHAKDFLAAGVRRLIVDESSKIKTHDSQITRAVHAFADLIDSVYLLSGTPAPNNPTEYFGQLRALGRGVSGSSYWSFAHRFAVPIRRRVRDREVIAGWTQTPDQQANLVQLLGHHAWSLRKQDCLDLPSQTDQIIDVELGDEAETYRLVLDAFRLSYDAEDAIKTEAQLIKLRQVTGGTVKAQGVVRRVGTAKLDALADLLDSLGREPVVVWCEFTAEIDAICAMLAERGEPHGRIDGSTSHLAAQTARDFQSGATTRVVCHPAAAGHGITLTAASYAIYFSMGFSAEQYLQSRDRIHRIGQTRPCTYYHLIAWLPPDREGKRERTIDLAALRVVRGKRSVADELRGMLTDNEREGDQDDPPCAQPPTVALPSSSPPCSTQAT